MIIAFPIADKTDMDNMSTEQIRQVIPENCPINLSVDHHGTQNR